MTGVMMAAIALSSSSWMGWSAPYSFLDRENQKSLPMDVLNSHTATFASVVAFTTEANGIMDFGGIFLVDFG